MRSGLGACLILLLMAAMPAGATMVTAAPPLPNHAILAQGSLQDAVQGSLPGSSPGSTPGSAPASAPGTATAPQIGAPSGTQPDTSTVPPPPSTTSSAPGFPTFRPAPFTPGPFQPFLPAPGLGGQRVFLAPTGCGSCGAGLQSCLADARNGIQTRGCYGTSEGCCYEGFGRCQAACQ